ncbi:probable histone-lysine N-methyltransferase set-23 [Teleopsis dalmanni]|uniref:probable histone-lysine N-methyltransferase set-23 n=1 Tax=Teleopsis dalmanni TaxID=139649 RepID=UPI0018CD0A76|nr:probable histone-lysine N-methyltransferase set-23 [Teleopsis dalmanni]
MQTIANSTVINDDYEHPDKQIEYILENVLCDEVGCSASEDYKTLLEQYNSVILSVCQCDESQNCSDCRHGGNYHWNHEAKELVLQQKRNDLIYECTTLCTCNPNVCLNRLVQNGPRANLKIIDSKIYKSKGLMTTKAIPKGAFICEYAGELLTHATATYRIRQNEKNHKMNYILCMNEINTSDSNRLSTIVDPSLKGNIGRYLNHSCTPNCELLSVRVDCFIPKIAIFASRNIAAGEELCFHYGGGMQTSVDEIADQTNASAINRIKCLCGTEDCEQFLPCIQF